MAKLRAMRGKAAAILGGAFDPVHEGHLYLARRALKELPATQVRLIPNGEPPHRAAPVTSWRLRLQMCEQATAQDKNITVGEDEPPGKPRRTVTTIRKLGKHSRLILIVGADAFRLFRRWKEWRAILKLTSVAVANRQGSPRAFRAAPSHWLSRCKTRPKKLWRGAYFWNVKPPRVSSTELRARKNKNK